jgi:AmmeMemoRadiSam system protein A
MKIVVWTIRSVYRHSVQKEKIGRTAIRGNENRRTVMPGALDSSIRTLLLETAREAIRSQILGGQHSPRIPPAPDPTAVLPDATGVFVTVHVSGALRGCIGFLELLGGLLETVAEAARRAAAFDPRFLPVEEDELPDCSVDVTLLGQSEPMTSPEDFIIGVHGLILEYAGRRGLLLPQVAVEHRFGKTAFLSALCRKTGVPDASWTKPDARISRFTGTVVTEHDVSAGP